jgi:hypothetical protein
MLDERLLSDDIINSNLGFEDGMGGVTIPDLKRVQSM